MKFVLGSIVAFLLVTGALAAQADLDISSPAIQSVKRSMQSRHAGLAPQLAGGAVGLTRDGLMAVRDAGSVPLAERSQVHALVAEENRDRAALYREIARANQHPEWEAEIRATFASRWIDKAPAGYWYQDANGNWARK